MVVSERVDPIIKKYDNSKIRITLKKNDGNSEYKYLLLVLDSVNKDILNSIPVTKEEARTTAESYLEAQKARQQRQKDLERAIRDSLEDSSAREMYAEIYID